MINVAVAEEQQGVVEEFFELFKTAWCLYRNTKPCAILLTNKAVPEEAEADLCIIFAGGRETARSPQIVKQPAGPSWPIYSALLCFPYNAAPLLVEADNGQTVAYMTDENGRKIIHVGYDLFAEVERLLTVGQPLKCAKYPTLDYHIAFLRHLILYAGYPVVEIPPCPGANSFITCLTHDVDFIRIRNHGLSKTTLGFICRATVGSIRRVRTGRLSIANLVKNVASVFALPLIHLRLMRDFWFQFDTYRQLEGSFRSTFFMIPFKKRAGQNVNVAHPERRATRYDVADVADEVKALRQDGWEIGLHGIDAWWDLDAAKQEKARITGAAGDETLGTRMHWLCADSDSPRILEQAGFEYDATCGYNETIGYRAGTTQAFKPLNCSRMLEVPLHIQDVAMFYPAFLDLDFNTAWTRCMQMIDHAEQYGGITTLLWHMRSTAPERQWGEFYVRLIREASDRKARIGTAHQAANWFQQRRALTIQVDAQQKDSLAIRMQNANDDTPDIRIRVHDPDTGHFRDIPWNGKPDLQINVKQALVEEERT